MADDEEHTTHTDPAGYEIDLDELERKLTMYLDKATAYLVEDLKKLSVMGDFVLKDLVGDGSPDQSESRRGFAGAWDTYLAELLRRRTKLVGSVRAFTDAMHDVLDTYRRAEEDNAGHFHSLTRR